MCIRDRLSAQHRWDLFRSLSDYNDNALHRSVVNEYGWALVRNMNEWQPPAEVSEQLTKSYQTFREAVQAGDGASAEHAARGMHLLDA